MFVFLKSLCTCQIASTRARAKTVFGHIKHSSPREKVGKLSSFWDWWAEFLFVSIVVLACEHRRILLRNMVFFLALTMPARVEKIRAKRFALAISVHYRDFEHAYVY